MHMTSRPHSLLPGAEVHTANEDYLRGGRTIKAPEGELSGNIWEERKMQAPGALKAARDRLPKHINNLVQGLWCSWAAKQEKSDTS